MGCHTKAILTPYEGDATRESNPDCPPQSAGALHHYTNSHGILAWNVDQPRSRTEITDVQDRCIAIIRAAHKEGSRGVKPRISVFIRDGLYPLSYYPCSRQGVPRLCFTAQ
jgi:hypothetical protein